MYLHEVLLFFSPWLSYYTKGYQGEHEPRVEEEARATERSLAFKGKGLKESILHVRSFPSCAIH